MSQQMEVTASLTGNLTGCKRRLICEKHRITLNRCRSRKAQTATKTQLTHLTARVGPAQLIAFWLRVLFCGQGQEAKVRRALGRLYSPSRASQVLAETRQCPAKNVLQETKLRQFSTDLQTSDLNAPKASFDALKSRQKKEHLAKTEQ